MLSPFEEFANIPTAPFLIFTTVVVYTPVRRCVPQSGKRMGRPKAARKKDIVPSIDVEKKVSSLLDIVQR
jgi:hypothetical protein